MAQRHENPNTAEKAEKARQERYGTSKRARKLVEPQPVPEQQELKRTGPSNKKAKEVREA